MKKIFLLSSCLFFCLLLGAQAQESSTKIKIKVKDADGQLIEKEYTSQEAFENDPELKALGIEVEAEEGRLRVRSKEGSNQTIIVQQGGGDRGNYSYQFQGPADATDSLWQERTPFDKEEMDSLMQARRAEMHQRRDSARSFRHDYREQSRENIQKHKEKMAQQREKMHAHREEMRARMRERHAAVKEENRLIIIEELEGEEAEPLKKNRKPLELNELRFSPDPGQDHLQIAFETKESGPVQIKLIATNTNQVVYRETRKLKKGVSFQETIQLENYTPGRYRLEISQHNKVLHRKVILK